MLPDVLPAPTSVTSVTSVMFDVSTKLLLLAVASASLVACDDDPAAPDGGVVPCEVAAAQRYLPLAVGASWTYDTSDQGAPVVRKSTTVEELEDVGDRKKGVTAFRIRTDKVAGHVVSWQQDLCTSIVRHRERSFDAAGVLLTDQFYVPGKLRVDESAAHLAMGSTFSTEYTEVEVDPVKGTTTVSKQETWTVEATSEMVTVPAGTFPCLKLRKITSGQADKRFWFSLGVGKIKEEGEQLELLTAYTLPPSMP